MRWFSSLLSSVCSKMKPTTDQKSWQPKAINPIPSTWPWPAGTINPQPSTLEMIYYHSHIHLTKWSNRSVCCRLHYCCFCWWPDICYSTGFSRLFICLHFYWIISPLMTNGQKSTYVHSQTSRHASLGEDSSSIFAAASGTLGMRNGAQAMKIDWCPSA